MLFLLAHIANGEARKDVGTRFTCPLCQGTQTREAGDCDECQEGFWYILPTTGGRAYPYQVAELTWEEGFGEDVPEDWPDYYQGNRQIALPDDGKGKDLLAKLGLLKPAQPVEPIRRRI